MSKFTVSAVGCSLADYLYTKADFTGEAFDKYCSRKEGDGGLSPGHLVFAEDLEEFSGVPYPQIAAELGCGGEPDAVNLGGPCIVALINAAQLNRDPEITFNFYGALGEDKTADRILSIIRQTPVNIDHYVRTEGMSPFSDCISDPNHHGGKGERLFVNRIGAAGKYLPDMLGDDFFAGDILFYGATALVPQIHDNLHDLLEKGRRLGKVNVVTTVFDFRNEKTNPGGNWPLGKDGSIELIDLLIMDWDEAMKISGAPNDINAAAEFFIRKGVGAFVVTHGALNIYAWSGGKLFKKLDLTALPVCEQVDRDIKANPESRGDTTGCGDNFAGGVLSALVNGLAQKKDDLDLVEAVAWGSASGGFACFTIGGTYLEKFPGDKRKKVERYYNYYSEQLGRK
jgi:sugar/nucleoside kinase (ribokinase family)